jgi:hypothetical protein
MGGWKLCGKRSYRGTKAASTWCSQRQHAMQIER